MFYGEKDNENHEKTEERIKTGLTKFRKVLEFAKERELNESDTVAIITDILAEVFGYDKYLEVTSELAVRGMYCDLAIKIGEKFEYLIECKAIGHDLKENHLRQAINYGANKGIQWVVLTNGMDWQVYRLRFEQPIAWDLVARIDMSVVDMRVERDPERLFILTKEGVEKNARVDLFEKGQCVNRYVCAQLLLQEPVVNLLKREFRKMADGLSVEEAEILALLRDGVLRRDLLDCEDSAAAKAKILRFYKSQMKKPVEKRPAPAPVTAPQPIEQPSITETLLAAAEAQEKGTHEEVGEPVQG